MKEKKWSKKMQSADFLNGEPRGDGHVCATCGQLASWGTHRGCERKKGQLIVWA